MNEIKVESQPVDAFSDVIERRDWELFTQAVARVKTQLGPSTTWHVNSTSTGGGVAEILQSAIGYLVDAGIHARWLTIDGNDAFFEITKRLHHLLHGKEGDGGPLGPDEAAVYENTLAPELDKMLAHVEAGDVVVLHDPQTAGLAPALAERGILTTWNCHVGADEPNEHAERAWEFLSPYVASTSAQVFSRREHVWTCLDSGHVAIIPPCIDAFSAKNMYLNDSDVDSILVSAGIEGARADTGGSSQPASSRRVTARSELLEDAPIPPGAPIVVQVSRWDPLKDHAGVMTGFVSGVPEATGAHLLLLGPSAAGVSDDPEGPEVWREMGDEWNGLSDRDRQRVHLASVPMDNAEENALVVNAVQRRAAVIVQKSMAEGFGLTVTEAMWKGRPVVASCVGGINDQIDSGTNGILVNPEDLDALGRAVTHCLTDAPDAQRMGVAARQRVVEEYLAPRYLTRHLALVEHILNECEDR